MDEQADPPFRRVDWAAVDSRRRLTPERLVVVAGTLVTVALFLYYHLVARVYLVGRWDPAPIHWAVLLALTVLIAYGVVPAVRHPRTARQVRRTLRRRPGVAVSVGVVGLVTVVGLVVAPLVGEPPLNFAHAYQPPLGVTAQLWGPGCVGPTTQGSGITIFCQGSLRYPYGTNAGGQPLDYLVIAGARPATFVVLVTVTFIAPLAAAVGVAAGLRGGRLDDLLTAYVDVQLSIPALFVYFIGYMYFNASLLLLVATFGLLSWGGVARLVRSEVIQRREAGHVVLARSLGASDWYLARHHVLPNVTNTLAPAVCHLCAILVLAEAGVAFLGFSNTELTSWGTVIAAGLETDPMRPDQVWWVSTVPALALTAFVAALKLAGDGLRDALDPRGGQS